MNISRSSSKPSRRVLATLPLAALILAVFVGSALAAATNLVKNGSMEKDANGNGIPNNWTGNGLTPADKRVCNQSYVGSCSFKMVLDGSPKELYQNVTFVGSAGDEFNLSVWTKGKEINSGAGVASIYVYFYLTAGGTDQWAFALPDGTSPWTLRQLTATAGGDYNAMLVGLLSDSAESGKFWFDKVKLVGP